MDPNNKSADNQTPTSKDILPVGPETPQPLDTTGSGMSETTSNSFSISTPDTAPPSGGLPPQLPGNPEVGQASGSRSRKIMMLIIIILILAILGVGGYYFYMQYGASGSSDTASSISDTQTAGDLSALETEVESIQITDPGGDLIEIDSEINLLEATPASSAAKTTR